MKDMTMTGPQTQLATEIIARNTVLKTERATWDTLWQDISSYVQPRMSQITARKTEGVEGFTDELYNLTAVRANQVLGSGMMDYLMSGQWFAFDPPSDNTDEAAKTYTQRCTEIVMREFARSNLYLEAHEMCLDRGGFGTASLMIEEGKKSLYTFTKFDVGSFSCAEDADGNVDTFFREFELTARQCRQKFGEEYCGKSVTEALAKEGGKGLEMKFQFIHAIYPREDEQRKPKKIDGENKPIASVYVNVKDKCVCRNSGYDEMPTAVTRFLKWGKSAYGYSPSIEALPTIKQVNFIEQQMDALAEIAAFPRILQPAGMDGEVDMRSGGITMFDPNAPDGAKPTVWGTEGQYEIGLERIKSKDDAIKEAYHYDLFQMLKQIDAGKMTAYEVAQRLAEKVAAFSPTFRRMDKEVFQPLLTRAFNIAYRAGKLPEPPASLIQTDAKGVPVALMVPEITLTSKLALAIKEAENNAFLRMVQVLQPIAEMHPEILDNYDLDKVARGVGKNYAVPVAWQRAAQDVEEIRSERAKQQQQQMAAAQAPQLAKAAKDAKDAMGGAGGMM